MKNKYKNLTNGRTAAENYKEYKNSGKGSAASRISFAANKNEIELIQEAHDHAAIKSAAAAVAAEMEKEIKKQLKDFFK